MKPTKAHRRPAAMTAESNKTMLMAFLLLASVAALPAANLYWDGGTTDIAGNGNGASGGTTGTWNTTTKNWDTGAVPYVAWDNTANANDTAVFAGMVGTVTIGSAITTNGMVLGTASYILSGANTITLNGTTPTITAIANATIGNNTATVLDGTAGLTKAGAATLTLNSSATHTLAGGLTVNAGTLALSLANLTPPTDPFNTGNTLTLGGGILTVTGKASTASAQTLGNLTLNSGGSGITVTGGSSSTMNLTLGNTWTHNTGGMLAITLGSGSTVGTLTSTPTTVNGIIGPWATVGATTAARYATVNGSVVAAYNSGTAAADGSGLLSTDGTVNYDLATFGGTVPDTVSANTIRYAGAAGTTAPGATSFTVNGLMNTGTGVWTIGTNAITIGSDKELVVNAIAKGITISSVIKDSVDGASNVTLLTAGSSIPVVLGGANTYTGIFTVNGNGVLGDSAYGLDITAAGGLNAAGVAGALGKSGTASSNIVLNKAVIKVNTNSTTDHGFTITGNCGFYVKGAFTATISGTITGTGTLCSDGDYNGGADGGSGNLKLTGSNDFTGDMVIVNDGRVTLGHENAISMATLVYDASVARVLADLTTANRAYTIGGLRGNKNLNLGTGLGNSGSGIVSIGNNNQSNSYSGTLSGGAGFAKIGTGTQTLYGAAAYSGGTTVQGGTLNLGGLAAVSMNATGASGAKTLTALSSTAGLATGQSVTGASVGANAVIVSIDSGTQVTLNVAHTAAFSATSVTFGATAGSLPATQTTVADTATLAGTGTVNGALYVNAGGSIQPTTSGTPGTLTLASATSPAFGAYSKLKLRVPTTSTADKIALTNSAAAFSCNNIDLIIDATGLPTNVSGVTIVQVANPSGGITGTFHSVTSNNGYSAAVHYNAQSITIDLYVPVPHLAITAVNGGVNPTVNTGFDVTVQAQDDSNNPSTVSSTTNISLSVGTGTGNLGGTMSGTIAAGTHTAVISGVTYDKAESGVVLTVSRTSGDNLTAGNSLPITVINPPTTLATASGNNQSASFGTVLTSPFVVTVTDANGNPVPGISVVFAIASAPAGATGQVLSATTVATDSNGHASTILTLGDTIGTYTVTATVSGLAGNPQTFTVEALPYTGNIYWDGGSSDILTNGNGASEGGDGTWDTNIKNWDTSASAHVVWSNDNYLNAIAIFDGTPGAVTLGASDISVGKLMFTGAYTLAGNGLNLTLNGSGTTISGGTLSGFNSITMANNQTWATTASGGTINTAGYTLTLGAASVTSVITGSGGLTLTGAATLNAANDYTGVTTITNSPVFGSGVNPFQNAGVPSRFGAATADPSNMIVNASEIRFQNVNPTTDHGFTLIGACGFYEKNGTLTINGTITGAGSLSMKGDFTNGNGGNGTLVLGGANDYTGDTILAYDCRIVLANVNAAAQSTLNTSGARAYFDLATHNLAYVIGGLKGTGNLNLGSGTGGGSGAVSFGNNNQSNIYSGVLSGTAGFTKIGGGIQTLAGINTYTGNTVVSAGQLILADNAGLMFVVTNTSNNMITDNAGTGSVVLDGDITIDTTAVTVSSHAWTLVQVADPAATFTSTFTVAGFNPEPDGITWTLVDGAKTWTFSEVTGMLTLATAGGSAYTQWATDNGLDDSNKASNLNPDNDGAVNLLEFALAGDPLDGANNGLALAKVQDVGGSPALILTIAVRSGATFAPGTDSTREATVDGIIYRIEGSTDLSNWNAAISEVIPAIPLPAPNATPPAGYEYHTFRTAGPVSGTPADFIRVKVSE